MYRREPIRGLLFVPRPDDDEKNNFNHFDNTTLIKNQLFWQDLLKEREHLGFNSISLNYGMWETKQARSEDKYIQNCHGHVHLNFDDIGWEDLKTKISEDSGFTSLSVRSEPQLMVESSTKLAGKLDNVVTALSETNSVLFETNSALSKLVDLLTPKEHSNAKND
ncbi:hypothetical protein C1645_815844 [Glomus cerebriforme]|uniref:Uncharacterized protein n=1 Tax=Glomus cerebriforme TaxID=658196 RepID=A0A397TI22_9GLOM|nr:hypothetical protein C1645_815844 [Glomus cerebriforme]